MDSSLTESQPTEVADPSSVLVRLGDAADLTLGEGGTGSESKRYEYN
jgi:hypothetical protein